MTSPSASDAGKSNWVTIWPSCSRRMIGMMSMSGSLDMITPAACTPHWRFRFSMPRAVSKTFCASASAPIRCPEVGRLLVALGGLVDDVA